MSDEATFDRLPCVRFERLLPGPADRVWEVLTKADRLPGWYGEGKIEARVGGAVSLLGGHVRGTVTHCRQPVRLSYSWNVHGVGETVSPYPESYVSFDLEPRGTEVLLRLTHLPVLQRFEMQNAMGWHTFLDMLEAAVRCEPVEDRLTYMSRNAERYGVDLDNLAR